MARVRTSRRGARRCGLKAEPEIPRAGGIVGPALPTAQHDRLGADKLYVDPEVALLPAFRRVEPTQELAQTVAVREDVHRRPVDWGLLVVDRVCGGEEWKQWILGHAGPVLIDKVGAVIGPQGKREIVPDPHRWRTYVKYPMVNLSSSSNGRALERRGYSYRERRSSVGPCLPNCTTRDIAYSRLGCFLVRRDAQAEGSSQ
jgi:hypothetical protein